jgi:hypothetical protein
VALQASLGPLPLLNIFHLKQSRCDSLLGRSARHTAATHTQNNRNADICPWLQWDSKPRHQYVRLWGHGDWHSDLVMTTRSGSDEWHLWNQHSEIVPKLNEEEC